MQIVVEATPNYLNVGDSAMLKVCLERLRSLWPDARVLALTSDPCALQANFPGVDPLPGGGRDVWFDALGVRAQYAAPRSAHSQHWCGALAGLIRDRCPRLANRFASFRLRGDALARELAARFFERVRNTDLFVVSGMGSFTSAFEPAIANMLETIALMKSMGVPSVAFSQGIGPLERSSRTWAVARRTLARLDFVALREGRFGPALLRDLGMTPDAVRVTGDDAIQLAYHEGAAGASGSLGVNLRLAGYSRIDARGVQSIAGAIRAVAGELRASIVPVPISWVPEESDVAAFEAMFPDLAPDALRGAKPTPEWSIHQAGRCRVVVTGAYHAAVFALSQGIPAVCIANSEYYSNKFGGLAGQFGTGCRIIDASGGLAELPGAIRSFWREGHTHRARLLAAARDQIQSSRSAWNELPLRIPVRSSAPRKAEPSDETMREVFVWYRRRLNRVTSELERTVAYLHEVEDARDRLRERAERLEAETRGSFRRGGLGS